MKTKNYYLAAIAGAVVLFLSGAALYGAFLMNFLTSHSGLSKDILEKLFRPVSDTNWYAYVIFHLAGGFLVATTLSWANAKNLYGGLRTGACLGFLLSAYWIFSELSFGYMYTLTSAVAQIIGETIMVAMAGAVAGWVLGLDKETTSAN